MLVIAGLRFFCDVVDSLIFFVYVIFMTSDNCFEILFIQDGIV